MKFLLLMACLIPTALRAEEGAPTYEREVKSLLKKRCTVCHNARKVDDLDISGGLALDSFEAALKGTKEHAVIVAGSPTKSELFARLIDTDEDRRMPLMDKPLDKSEQTLLRRWLDAGAPRGTVSGTAETGPRKRARHLARSLDVVVPLDVKAPAAPKGLGPGGPVQLVLKAGPLPSTTALAFRGDGRLLAVGTHGAVVVWDLVDGRPALSLADIPGPVHALAFSRDGRRLAIGSGAPAETGSVRVYDVPGGTLLHDFTGHGDVVFGLAFRPDGGQLASCSLDKTVRFWDLASGRLAGVFRGHSDFVYDVAYDRDGKTVLTVSKDRSIKRIDASTLKEKRTFSGHDDDVLAVAVSSDGRFVSAGNEPQLRWWASDGEKPAKRIGGHSGPVHQLSFSADGSKLISAGGDGSVRIWDGRTGAFVKAFAGASEWQYAVALSADASLAAAGGWDGLTRVWETSSGKLRATFLHPPRDDSTGPDWLAVAPSGYYAASAAMPTMLRWKVNGQEIAADEARRTFDRPDELSKALQGTTVSPAFK